MKRVISGSIISGMVSVFILIDTLGGYASLLSLIVFGLMWYSLGVALIISGVKANNKSRKAVSKQ